MSGLEPDSARRVPSKHFRDGVVQRALRLLNRGCRQNGRGEPGSGGISRIDHEDNALRQDDDRAGARVQTRQIPEVWKVGHDEGVEPPHVKTRSEAGNALCVHGSSARGLVEGARSANGSLESFERVELGPALTRRLHHFASRA